jgi:hypothetical protein
LDHCNRTVDRLAAEGALVKYDEALKYAPAWKEPHQARDFCSAAQELIVSEH